MKVLLRSTWLGYSTGIIRQIKEVVALGDGKDYCTAFINIDLEAVGNWAERNNVPYASYQELANDERVYQMMLESIEKVPH